jgi:heme-degrading monooxygenase HmoA
MHVILWRFRVRPGHDAAFHSAYGEGGAWAQLFRSDAGFVGTELMRGTDGTYLTIDRWVSEDASRRFRDAQAAPYAELDARCSDLTIEETLLGAFEI